MESILHIQLFNQTVAYVGNAALLAKQKTGLLCSRKCPASIILEAHDQFKTWATDSEKTVVSGFHSPVEKECLRLLLRGRASIIVCPAREIEHMRIPKDWKPALDGNRMLILSPFTEKRASARTVERRNRLVADLADNLYVPYATPGGMLGCCFFKD